jgi:hypothetical protein
VKFKPPGKRGLIRGLAVSGVAIASVSSLVMSQAPAFADPSITYMAVGSDTTQKLMDAFTVDVAGNLIASYDAVNPTSTTSNQIAGEIITAQKTGTGITGPVAGSDVTANYAPPRYCSFTRPNGSGAGVNSMRQSDGSTATISTAAGESFTPSSVSVTGPDTEVPPVNRTIPGITSVTVTGNDTENPPVSRTVTGPVTATVPNNAPQSGCVDVVRSSSGPASTVLDATAGNFIYIPFGLDSVAASVGSAGNLTALLTPATSLSLPQLQAMYKTGTGAVIGSTCYEPTNGVACTGTTTTVMVNLYVPQPGSGTRNFWLTTMDGSVPSPLPAWVFDHIQAGTSNGQAVEEHDGTAVSSDPNGLGPFSVSQWIQEQKPGFGHSNFVAQAVVAPMAATTGGTVQAAFNGTVPNATLNASFPVLREVYNVLQYDRVVNTGDGAFDANLAGLFVGINSQLCQDAIQISTYGFASLSSAPLGHHCGDIDTTKLRAFGHTTGF